MNLTEIVDAYEAELLTAEEALERSGAINLVALYQAEKAFRDRQAEGCHSILNAHDE